MKLLLDTHTFLWFINGDPRLSQRAQEWIEDPEHERYLSIASLWEITIKVSLGKLRLPSSITQLIDEHVLGNAIRILPIRPQHLGRLASLPFHHRDPFDRLLIAQGREEEMHLLTRDPEFKAYDVLLEW